MTALIIADDDSVDFQVGAKKADVLISCGDVADHVILKAAATSGCRQILAVKGNHDGSGSFPPPIVDLHVAVRNFGGLQFGGFNGSWKYKPRGNYLYEQSEVEILLRDLPAADIFVAHNSPRLVHERDEDVHVGFAAFNTYIKRAKPLLFIPGHQHVNQETMLGTTRVIGVFGQRLIVLPERSQRDPL